MKNIDKISIIHYTKLESRKAHMLGELERWFSDTEHEFVEEFDQEDLTQELIDQNFDLKVFEERFDRKMLISEMSLCLKYKKAISDIANSEKGKHFFILEDDVIRRYIELGCEVKGLGRGHIKRIKDSVKKDNS